MAISSEAVRNIIAPLLLETDAPTLEYIATIIADDAAGPLRSLQDDLLMFLVDVLDCDEPAALARCEQMESRLRRVFGEAAAKQVNVADTGAFDAPKTLADLVVDTPEVGDVHTSRLFKECEDDKPRTSWTSMVDGVPLSHRTGPATSANFGLRPIGVERERRKLVCRSEKPISANKEARFRMRGGKNAACLGIVGMW